MRQLLAAVVTCVATVPVAHGQTATYPQQGPITIVVPFAAGSPTDVVARVLAQDLGPMMKTRVIVENRPGAGQVVAASFVHRAAPDGNTLLSGNLPNATPPSVLEKLSYRDFTDFAPAASGYEAVSIGTASSTFCPSRSEVHPYFPHLVTPFPQSRPPSQLLGTPICLLSVPSVFKGSLSHSASTKTY